MFYHFSLKHLILTGISDVNFPERPSYVPSCGVFALFQSSKNSLLDWDELCLASALPLRLASVVSSPSSRLHRLASVVSPLCSHARDGSGAAVPACTCDEPRQLTPRLVQCRSAGYFTTMVSTIIRASVVVSRDVVCA